MKTIILSGGFGTRISEETETRPKPMIEIGGRPILWHIMKIYAHYGFNEFILALGYKADYVKKYFLDYVNYSGHLTVHIQNGKSHVTQREQDEWTIHLEDTGFDTMTGGRIKKLSSWVKGEPFMVTYGDGVSNIDIKKLLAFHKEQGKLATITAVRPPARFGGLCMENGLVKEFMEKPLTGEGWINGGFMILEPQVLDMISGSATILETDVLEELARMGQLAAYSHDDFWQCMDTMRDLKYLEGLWSTGNAPWKMWG
jgi:glucose-1-phosphate cytidylyltransferase